jgi:ankyrin repeat protein
MPNDDFTSHKGNFLPAHFICDSENITVEALELLLDTFPEEASELSKSGKLPLHVACGNEHVNVKAIELLVSVNPNAAKVTAEVQDEESKQRKSVAFNRIKQQQLEDNLLGMMDVKRAPSGLDSEDPNTSDDRLALESGRTPLHFASENKAMKWDALRVVIDANPEVRNCEERTTTTRSEGTITAVIRPTLLALA